MLSENTLFLVNHVYSVKNSGKVVHLPNVFTGRILPPKRCHLKVYRSEQWGWWIKNAVFHDCCFELQKSRFNVINYYSKSRMQSLNFDATISVYVFPVFGFTFARCMCPMWIILKLLCLFDISKCCKCLVNETQVYDVNHSSSFIFAMELLGMFCAESKGFPCGCCIFELSTFSSQQSTVAGKMRKRISSKTVHFIIWQPFRIRSSSAVVVQKCLGKCENVLSTNTSIYVVSLGFQFCVSFVMSQEITIHELLADISGNTCFHLKWKQAHGCQHHSHY